ncbi:MULTISPECIES: sporulation integral membrane protein YtvI [Metabacillus]|uniref:sporulation integral membrane protein YtvI n=1 Tax=Metabacillus TaxID=2675233 RepID=UPI0004932AA6|nr:MULTISPECIES: sporulation integral membrane protein YtvI [Metabacillus]KEZ49957.1 membrane protein [Metabacillus indicus LMG 22858]MDX8288225.1 sporulation integral membrane protein YtvI [Metabacillus indicus]
MSTIFTKRRLLTALFIVLIGLIIYFLLPISVPLIMAFLTALLLEPLVRLLQNRAKLQRKLSVLITFLLFLCLIAVSGYFITTKVVGEAIITIENAPEYINEITVAWNEIEERFTHSAKDLPPEFVNEISNQVKEFLEKTKADLASSVNIENVKTIITNIPDYMVNMLVFLIALFLFMLELPNLKMRMYAHMKENTAQKVNFMINRMSYVIFGFVKAQFLVSIIIFIASFIGLMLIMPEVALVMAIIIWVIDVIPIIGSIIIMGPWTLYHLISGDTILAAKLGILTAVLLIIRRTVEPKVMGSHIGLSPLATLISMYLGLKLFGVLGFFIGPMILIIYNSAREAGIIRFTFKI